MKNISKLEIFCDGGARGNPGPAAAAFVVYRDGKMSDSQSEYLGVATNNVAEYSAVLLALEWLTNNADNKNSQAVIYLDSELVVKQINGSYKVKNKKLKELHGRALGLLKNYFVLPVFKNIPRHKNNVADSLVNQELDNETP